MRKLYFVGYIIKLLLLMFLIEAIAIKPVIADDISSRIVESLNVSSNILIIGDSRIFQMHLYGNRDVSYVAVGGGHYSGYDEGNFLSINSSSRVSTIKRYIKEIVKRHGNCTIVVEPTVNDYLGNGDMTSALNNYIDFVKEVTDYYDNTTVFAINLIGGQDANVTQNNNIDSFNQKVKESARNSGKFQYVDVSPDIKEYADNYHFTSNTTKKIYDNIINATINSNSNRNRNTDNESNGLFKLRRLARYEIDYLSKYIFKIPGYTTVDDFRYNFERQKRINFEMNGELEINGVEDEYNEYIKTGDIVNISDEPYIAVVEGDIDGDGKSTYKDILMEQWLYDNPNSDLVDYANMKRARRRTSGNCSAGSQDILDTCVEVLQYMIDNNIYYAAQTSGDIEKTATQDTAYVCCTYVAVVLYRCGALTAEQINPYNYHYTHDFGNMLANAGWQEVPHSEIQPGDIINCFGGQITPDNEHVMIYAGNDACYDEACAQRYNSTEPRADEWNWYKNLAGTTVWRAPYGNSSNSEELKSKLDNTIKNATSDCGGKWAVYAESLDSGEQSISNNTKMNAKSLINLFIMGTVYENYSKYESKNNIDSNLKAMIVNDDIQAANSLIELLGNGNSAEGRDKVNSFCKTHGYTTTNIGANLSENSNKDELYTSVADCGKFLKNIYKGELNQSQKMMDLLKQQQKKGQIAAGVSNVNTISIIDEESNIVNEASIVLTDKPYILVVMSQNINDTNKAKNKIKGISNAIYNYFKK